MNFGTQVDLKNGMIISIVTKYSDLPSAILVPGQYYRTLQGENASWRPTWLGGTYYPEGIYYSDGSSWDYVGEFPYQADQSEVDAGVNDKNFVTPLTFENASKWNTKFNTPTGAVTDYLDGTGAPQPFPTISNEYTRIVKSANQDITGTTGNDSDFTFPVDAGGIYQIKLSLMISSNNTTADTRVYFQSPSVLFKGVGSLLAWNAAGSTPTVASLRSVSNFSAAAAVGQPTADIDEVQSVFGEVTYRMASAGTLYLGFGNNVNTPGAISRMWAGSAIEYKKIN